MQIEKVRVRELKIYTKPAFNENGEALRMAINAKWQDNPKFHGHGENGKPMYRLPPVRFIPSKMPRLIAIKGAFEELDKIYEAVQDDLRVYSNEYKIIATEILDREYDFGTADELFTYKSISPWIALNDKNYKKYLRYGIFEKRKKLLKKIFVGNILALAKSLGIRVDEKILAKLDTFHERKVNIKKVDVMAFYVKVTTNFVLPKMLGIGKHASLGFGRFESLNGE